MAANKHGKGTDVQTVEDTTKEKHQVASTQSRGMLPQRRQWGNEEQGCWLVGKGEKKAGQGGLSASTSVAQPRGDLKLVGPVT